MMCPTDKRNMNLVRGIRSVGWIPSMRVGRTDLNWVVRKAHREGDIWGRWANGEQAATLVFERRAFPGRENIPEAGAFLAY